MDLDGRCLDCWRDGESAAWPFAAAGVGRCDRGWGGVLLVGFACEGWADCFVGHCWLVVSVMDLGGGWLWTETMEALDRWDFGRAPAGSKLLAHGLDDVCDGHWSLAVGSWLDADGWRTVLAGSGGAGLDGAAGRRHRMEGGGGRASSGCSSAAGANGRRRSPAGRGRWDRIQRVLLDILGGLDRPTGRPAGARRRQQWLPALVKVMEHRVWCSGGAP
ncbi:hypothetical protein ACLOJK_023342 [Asimina triloba]